jgi:hypothetical protein
LGFLAFFEVFDFHMPPADILLMRKLYATLQLLLSRLLKRAAAAPQLPPSRATKSDSAASAMSIGKPAGALSNMTKRR